MIPAAFEYHRPGSVAEAVRLLQQHGDGAKLLAGGHSLLPAMRLRVAQPKVIVDLGAIPGLDSIREEDGAIAVGAMATHYQLETSEVLGARLPVLKECAARVGDVQVRNWGTLGGSLAHADPAADYPAVALACGARLVAEGSQGRRAIPADAFFVATLTTALSPSEVLVEVRFPAFGPRTGGAYLKLNRRASDFAIVGVCAQVSLSGDGRIEKAGVGITGVAPVAYRATAVENALAGQRPDAAALAKAAEAAVEGVDVQGDIVASADYRRHVAREYTRRALEAAVARAGK